VQSNQKPNRLINEKALTFLRKLTILLTGLCGVKKPSTKAQAKDKPVCLPVHFCLVVDSSVTKLMRERIHWSVSPTCNNLCITTH